MKKTLLACWCTLNIKNYKTLAEFITFLLLPLLFHSSNNLVRHIFNLHTLEYWITAIVRAGCRAWLIAAECTRIVATIGENDKLFNRHRCCYETDTVQSSPLITVVELTGRSCLRRLFLDSRASRRSPCERGCQSSWSRNLGNNCYSSWQHCPPSVESTSCYVNFSLWSFRES